MAQRSVEETLQSPEFQGLVARRRTVAVVLTIAILVVYFGFVLVLAFASQSLARPIGEHLTLGIPVGVGIILIAWLLTGIYVWWANSRYDTAVEVLKDALKR
jgi:uncharacterized membrane protein (DUF485 family)